MPPSCSSCLRYSANTSKRRIRFAGLMVMSLTMADAIDGMCHAHGHLMRSQASPGVASAPRLWRARWLVHRFVNPVTLLFAGWLPGFAILSHVGRRSGRRYRNPINTFRRSNYYVFALTYGSQVDWLKNVLAAGDCHIRTQGRNVHLVEPLVITDPDRKSTRLN